MPIKRFREGLSSHKPGLIVGQLHKGSQKTETGMGHDLDYWRFEPSENYPDIAAVFEDKYGKEPRRITVALPFKTPDEVFSEWCEVWSKSSLVHRCDGETAVLWREGAVMKTGSKPCPGGHSVKGGVEDPINDSIGRLIVIVPELIAAGYYGYVSVATKSKNDIAHILKVLDEVYRNHDDLRGILFELVRVKENISAPGFGKTAGSRTRVDKWLINLVPSAKWAQALLEVQKNKALFLEASNGNTSENAQSDPIEADPVTGEIFDEERMDIVDEPDGAPVEAVVKSTEPVKAEPVKEVPVKKSTPPSAVKPAATPASAKVERPEDVQAAMSVLIPFKSGKGEENTVSLGTTTNDELKKVRTYIEYPKEPERKEKYAEALVACEILIEYFDNGGK